MLLRVMLNFSFRIFICGPLARPAICRTLETPATSGATNIRFCCPSLAKTEVSDPAEQGIGTAHRVCARTVGEGTKQHIGEADECENTPIVEVQMVPKRPGTPRSEVKKG